MRKEIKKHQRGREPSPGRNDEITQMRENRHPWKWIPSLYFTEGMPQIVVAELSLLMYQQLGVGNALSAFYTSWFFLPWVMKPMWSPFIKILKTRRWWVLTMEGLMGAAFASLAFTIPTAFWWQMSVFLFWVVAFASTTHDIAADGMYIADLDGKVQSMFLTVRNIFYQMSGVLVKGILVGLAGFVQVAFRGQIRYSWSIVFYFITAFFIAVWLYHFFVLPCGGGGNGEHGTSFGHKVDELVDAYSSFFHQKNIIRSVLFMLLYFLPCSLIMKVQILFLRDFHHSGGLCMSPQEFSFAYGTIGVAGLLTATMAGGFLIRRDGLTRWKWPMTLAMIAGSSAYLLICKFGITDMMPVCVLVFLQQAGFGFGFCVMTFSLTSFSGAQYRTFHYSICSALMAASMMFPGMFSGVMQSEMGYGSYFLMSFLFGIVTVVVTLLVRIPEGYGRKNLSLHGSDEENR